MALQRRKLLAQALNRGYGTDTIPADSGGSLVGDKIGIHTFIGVNYVSLQDFGGGNFGDQLNTTIQTVPAGTVIDARSVDAATAFNTTVLMNKAVHVILPDYALTYNGAGSAAFDITTDGCSIIGNGMNSSLKMGAAVPLIRLNNVTKCHLRDFTVDGNSRGFAASGITVGTSTGITNLVQFERVRFVDIQGSAIALTSTAEFDDWELLFCVFDNCGTASAACVDLAGTCDTARFIGNQWEGFIGTGLSGSSNCLRFRAIGDKFHGDTPSNTNIAIDWNGYRSQFIGNQFNFIQGTDQILLKNVDNSFIGNEFTDPATGTNCFNLSSSGHRNRIIANEISGPTLSTGIGIKLDAVGDNIIKNNIIRNAGASAGFAAIKEVNAADRNLASENICINAGTVETITGVNSLFSDNGVLDSQVLVRRTQKFATGDATAPSVAGDAAIKRTGSSLGVIYFDDAKSFIVGYGNGGSPADSIELYLNSALKATFNTTNFTAAMGILSSSASGGVGYTAGAGNTVTQLTNKSTGVSINACAGTITMNNAALNGSTSVGFTVSNTSVAAIDIPVVSIKSGATADSYVVTVDAVAANSFRISLRNISGGPLSEAVVLNFAIIKGANS